jgi:hypothetical protein
VTPLLLALTIALAKPPSPYADCGGCVATVRTGTFTACDCCPTPCANKLDKGLLAGGSCRDRDWSCFDDPATSCAALAWTPVRVAVLVAVLPVLLMKPKCDGPLPDVGSVVLALLFGQPLEVCATSRKPPVAEPKRGLAAPDDRAMAW